MFFLLWLLLLLRLFTCYRQHEDSLEDAEIFAHKWKAENGSMAKIHDPMFPKRLVNINHHVNDAHQTASLRLGVLAIWWFAPLRQVLREAEEAEKKKEEEAQSAMFEMLGMAATGNECKLWIAHTRGAILIRGMFPECTRDRCGSRDSLMFEHPVQLPQESQGGKSSTGRQRETRRRAATSLEGRGLGASACSMLMW